SRSIGYDRGPGFSLGGEADAGRPGVPFSELDLVPLDAERIERFAAAWFGSRDEALPFLIEIGVRDAQRQLVKNPRGDLYDLARIPLLLTLLARLAQESGELPHRRSTVYYRWLQKYFGEWVTDRPRRIPEAAIPAMLTLVGQASVDLLRRDDASKPPGAFEREDLRAALELHLPEPSSKSELSGVRASTVVDILAADGLLVADTPDESDVRFLHLSIQEYLAASSLAGPRLTTDVEGAVKAASEGLFVRSGRDVESELACSPTGDNVLRFLSGVHVDLGGEGTGGTRRLGAYVEVLLERAREHERQGRIYGLAARASCDWPQEARSTGSSLFERVRKELLHAFDARGASWPLADRLFALEALDSIGDPRLDEDDLWVEIRGGKVSLGDPKHFKAAPPHTAKVKPFCISFRPIVVADFEPFVEKGYAVERYWTCGRTEYDGSAPYDWDTQLRGPHNAPVTGVSWYAANAYCAWVSERWGYEVTLPTETQWECVARGKDGRSYPWGNEPPEFGDRARANHDFEGSPGRPTSIGAFPLGTSRAWSRPIVDLGGNVWEWCRDLWRGRDDDSWGQKPREAPENHRHRRVIRGGSWYYDDTFVHASSRYWNEPGNRLRSVGFRVVHPGASIRRSSGRRTWGR
ncbi:MAG TPA: SUMF1/EgtB/PvdO family nonheme iron enzyme, partial [Polyangiaceae bacterium]|nr:SUMF1/EgtB/PvdO family nonheme iron enzyme [Polyangiaceae bacterium]